jgi:hypothetical protein
MSALEDRAQPFRQGLEVEGADGAEGSGEGPEHKLPPSRDRPGRWREVARLRDHAETARLLAEIHPALGQGGHQPPLRVPAGPMVLPTASLLSSYYKVK